VVEIQDEVFIVGNEVIEGISWSFLPHNCCCGKSTGSGLLDFGGCRNGFFAQLVDEIVVVSYVGIVVLLEVVIVDVVKDQVKVFFSGAMK